MSVVLDCLAAGMTEDQILAQYPTLTVEGIRARLRSGAGTRRGRTGAVQLPAEYVAEHLELGYAQTSHTTQGRTVDVGLLLIDSPADSRGVYTLMTRGREANHAYVVTENNQTSLDALTQALARDWIDKPAISRRMELSPDRQRQVEPPLPVKPTRWTNLCGVPADVSQNAKNEGDGSSAPWVAACSRPS